MKSMELGDLSEAVKEKMKNDLAELSIKAPEIIESAKVINNVQWAIGYWKWLLISMLIVPLVTLIPTVYYVQQNVSDTSSKVDDTNKSIDSLQISVTTLELRESALSTEMGTIAVSAGQATSISSFITTLQSSIISMQATIDSLQTANDNLQASLQAANAQLTSYSTQLTNNQQRLNLIEGAGSYTLIKFIGGSTNMLAVGTTATASAFRLSASESCSVFLTVNIRVGMIFNAVSCGDFSASFNQNGLPIDTTSFSFLYCQNFELPVSFVYQVTVGTNDTFHYASTSCTGPVNSCSISALTVAATGVCKNLTLTAFA